MKNNNVTLFSKPGCGKCTATKRSLENKKIPFTLVDITTDPDAHDYVTNKLGYLEMPVVETDTTSWSGYDEDQISKIK